MSDAAKLRETVAPLMYKDAPTLWKMGYAAAPCFYGEIQPWGPWQMFRASPDSTSTTGVAIVCAIRPCGSFSIHEAAATQVSALSLDVRDARLARAVDDLIVSRLRWSDDTPVTERRSPVRTHPDSSATLRIFRNDENFPQHGKVKTGRYLLPKETATWSFNGHAVSITCLADCIVVSGAPDADASPYEWRDGDLLSVRRTQLPIMTGDDAKSLIREIDALMATKCAVR